MQDLNLQEGNAIIDNNIDLLWQQVQILFDTSMGDLFGDNNYGTDYDSLLYDMKLSAGDLKQKMLNDINKLDTFGMSYNVDVYLLRGTQQDIAVIKVDFYDSSANEHYIKIYKIS